MVSKTFVLKRLLLLVPVLFGVATFVFAILHLAPGDPARVILGQRATTAQVVELRRDLGLTDPIWVQYGRFLVDVVQLDFGQSYQVAQGTPVFEVLLDRLPVTIELALYGQFVAIVFGIPIGVLSAVRQDSLTDHGARIAALSGISVPIYWSGPLLILLFATFLGWLPTSGRIDSAIFLADHWTLFGTQLPLTGMVTVDTFILNTGAYIETVLNQGVGAVPSIIEHYGPFISAVRHLFLPVMVLGIYSMALITRMMRSSMLEVIRQDYMRTARAKGQGSKITVLKHGFRNALIPVTTVIGIQFGTLLGGAVLTETIFGIGGIGTLLVAAIGATDYPVVQGAVLVFALLFTLVNLGVDITYSYLDPRIQQ
jgi:peptide/nickel transport system permease protein